MLVGQERRVMSDVSRTEHASQARVNGSSNYDPLKGVVVVKYGYLLERPMYLKLLDKFKMQKSKIKMTMQNLKFIQ